MLKQQMTLKTTILWITKVILLINLIQIVSNQTSPCTEQWSQLQLTQSDWELIGDVSFNKEAALNFYRDPNELNASVGDVGGAAWYKVSRNHYNGIKITFTPSIIDDLNYYGNVKYPEGFAFVFTSNPIDGLIGNKRSGLGYDGINDAVAFEWDFIQNIDKNDIRDPHFSALYNLNGQISSASPTDCTAFCNVKIGNFYDDQKVNYIKSVTYSLEVYGGKLYLYENEVALINGVAFNYLDKLMDSDTVYFGVTSSMSLYKTVTINNLQLFNIVNSDKPVIEIVNPQQSYTAGVPLNLNLYQNSACGTHLNIFTSVFTPNFDLLVNGVSQINDVTLNFDSNTYTMTVTVKNLDTAGDTTLTPVLSKVQGTSLKINIIPGEITKYDICDPSNPSDIPNNLVGTTVSFVICTTDQFKNKKVSTATDDSQIAKIGYPYSIPSSTQPIYKNLADDPTKFQVTVQLTGIGTYTVYNENFFGDIEKTFDIQIESADSQTSYGEIKDYFENKNVQSGSNIYLYIYLKDIFGNDISSQELDALQCDFSESQMQINSQETTKYDSFSLPGNKIPIMDNLPTLTYTPKSSGQYTFIPKIKCKNDKAFSEINCSLCTFVVNDGQIDKSNFKVFSDYKNAFFLDTEAKPLFISLDENKNLKLTTLKFIDVGGIDMPISSIDISKVTVAVKSNGSSVANITPVFNPTGVIDLFLDSGVDRTSLFSPLDYYQLSVVITGTTYQFSINTSIDLQFAYKDAYLNNVDLVKTASVVSNFVVVYLPGHFTIKASSNHLLFRIISRNADNALTMGTDLDPSKVLVKANDANGNAYDMKAATVKSGIFLYVSGSPEKTGIYTVVLYYDQQMIQTIPLTVISRPEVYSLQYNSADPAIDNIDTQNNIITLKSIEIDTSLSFVMQMADQFGNAIQNDYLSVFNSISITSTEHISIQPQVDGSVTVLFDTQRSGSFSVTLTLPNEVDYTIKIQINSLKIDPSYSYSEIVTVSQPVGNTAKANIRFMDIYHYSDINSAINSNADALKAMKQNLKVYLIGPKNTLVSLDFDSYSETDDLFVYSSSTPITVAGEYTIHSYYQNVYMACSVCYANFTPVALDLTSTSAYLVGLKSNYRLYTDKRYQIIDTSISDNLVFFLVFQDKYGNEINNSAATYNLVLTYENDNSSPIKFCRVKQDLQIRQYFQVCSGNKITNLKNGMYHVAVDQNQFKFYITDTAYESDTTTPAPSATYSYTRNENGIVNGATDKPGRLVIDFRSANMIRYDNLDVSKISIAGDNSAMTDLSVNYLYGPTKGLVTALISTKVIGSANLTVKYDSNTVISGIAFTNKPGQINSLQFLDTLSVTFNKGTHHFFQCKDVASNNCAFESIVDTLMSNYLINVADSNNNFIQTVNRYNPVTGIFSIDIGDIHSELKVSSDFLTQAVSVPATQGTFESRKSFAYLEDETDAKISSTINLQINYLNSYINSFTSESMKNELANFSVLIVITDVTGVTKFLERLDGKAQLDNTTGKAYIPYTFAQSGDYLFVPLYKNSQMTCNMCRKQVIDNTVDVSKTTLQIRDIEWEDKTTTMTYRIFKNTYPVFKITFRDTYSSPINISDISKYSIQFTVDNGAANPTVLGTNIVNTMKHGVYVSLTADGRNQYLNLAPLTKLKLSVQNENQATIQFANIIVFNSESDVVSTAACQTDSVPVFNQNSLINVFRAGSDLILDFTLQGCASQEGTLFDGDQFSFNSDNSAITGQVVPAEVRGKYLLIITGNTVTQNPANISVKFKNSAASDNISVSIIAAYSINKLTFSSAGSYTLFDSHAYFYINAFDQFNNPYIRSDSMFFYNDLYFNLKDSSGNNIPYKITYSYSENAFYGRFDFTYSDTYTVSSRYADQSLNVVVSPGSDYSNSLAVVTKDSNNKYEFQITLRDRYYKTFTDNTIQLTSQFSFTYYTYNEFTNEDYTLDISSNNISLKQGTQNTLIVTLPDSTPIYKFATIIPYQNSHSIVCPTCAFVNSSSNAVYSFYSDDNENKYFSLDDSQTLFFFIDEKPILIYESDSATTATIQNVNIGNFSFSISQGGFLTFTGLDTLTKYDQTLSGSMTLKITDTRSLALYFNDYTVSQDSADANNSRLYCNSNQSFTVGGSSYIYVAVRDSKNIITTADPSLSLSVSDVQFNVINSSFEGIYLVEISAAKVPTSTSFQLQVGTSEISEKVQLLVKPGFPVSLDINSQLNINWYTERLTLVAADANGNTVCDYRLNIVMSLGNASGPIYITYDKEAKACYLYLNFANTVTIHSPLYQNGAAKVIQNSINIPVSPFDSAMILNQNNSNTDSPVTVTFELMTIYSRALASNYSLTGMSIKVYSLDALNSMTLVKEIDSISSMISQFTLEQLGITYGNYLFTADIEGNELKDYVPFKYYKSLVQVASNYSVLMKTPSQWEGLTNIYSPNSANPETISMTDPLTFQVAYLNSDSQMISVPNDTSLTVTLYQKADTTNAVINFEVIRNGETSYLASVPKNLIDNFIHLPVGDYIIAFKTVISTNNTLEKWLYTTVKTGLFQRTDLDVAYALPGVALTSPIALIGINNGNQIYTNALSYSQANICFTTNSLIYNDYLDKNKLQISGYDTSNCSVFVTDSLRGCLELIIYCKNVKSDGYTVTVSYNSNVISNSVKILIDPQLPPATVVVGDSNKFPSTVEQKQELTTLFNLKDSNGNKFQYVTVDNFEVYVNNVALVRNQDVNEWDLFMDANGITIKIYGLSYPPRAQTIQVLFKDSNGNYKNLDALTTTVDVKQGQPAYEKTIISFPVAYYAGNKLSFFVVVKDNWDNCFQDDLTVSDYAVNLKLNGKVFSDFTIVQQTVDFIYCSRVLSVTTTQDASPLTVVGTYDVDFLYQNTVEKSTTIEVLPNVLSPDKTVFTVVGSGPVSIAQVQAGTTIQIQMTGSDAYNNQVSYYDIAERMDVKLGTLTEGQDYFFTAAIDNSSSMVIISLTVDVLGKYNVDFYIDGSKFATKNGLQTLNVLAGPCSNKYPNVQISDSIYYAGDYGQITITCVDNFGNIISNKGSEQFNIDIKGTNLDIVGEDTVPCDLTFNTGVYNGKFLLAYKGKYTVQIYLNGQKYGQIETIQVLSQNCPADQPVMCSDKSCVSESNKCTNDIDSYDCPNLATPFYCKVNGKNKCVSSRTDCDCEDGYTKCKGMCLPQGANNFCTTPTITNCQSKLGTSNSISCPDGSCRFANSRCPNPMGCPLGYEPCGDECIKVDQTCTIQAPVCSSSQVLCWDLSCADSLDNCPTGKTCNNENDYVCPDGKCVSDPDQCSQPPTCYSPFSYLCPDFTCKMSQSDCLNKPVCFPGQSLCENNVCANDCSKVTSCPTNKFLCSTGQCVDNSLLCPTPITCPADKIKCPSGTCVDTFDQCHFVSASNSITCPISTPILCADLTCVSDASLCSSLPDCPDTAPFRCSNNECRDSLNNCPSTVTCPTDYPVLCSDGTCQKASYHCTASSDISVCNEVRCADGSCVNSLSLCPNYVSCNEGLIKCWDGSCVTNISQCRAPKYISCAADQPYRCPDGSCRVNKASCSTISICPVDKPVKCYDSSCRESIDLCPEYQQCGANMLSCPDGTCSSGQCNTVVTCPSSMPFLCYDNTCKIDIRDCPTPPSCPKGVMCPDGSCVSNRQLCQFFDPCTSQNPVRCQQGSCAASVDECYSVIRQCPNGYIVCPTGECKKNESLCPAFTCPSNLPVKCAEGTCVENLKYCDNKDTGCPYNLPYKCLDGTCVQDVSYCSKHSSATCSQGSSLCPDGSCRANIADCPLKNGCSTQKPFRCADGTCIDTSVDSCPPPLCPFTRPIKCATGECVATTAFCPQVTREKDYSDCNAIGFPGLFMCADGRCVPSPSYCLPLYSCADGYTRCSDGTCKLSPNLCPASSNCPSIRPIRCPLGKCVTTNSECVSNFLCPPDFPTQCDKTGECVKDSSQCPGVEQTVNGCTGNKPYKCLDGRCMTSQDKCSSVSLACTEEFPVLCVDGACVANSSECKGRQDTCQDGYTRCPDGTCVQKDQYYTACKNQIGCPFTSPMRCADGACVVDASKCKTAISCSSSAPVLCADSTCVSDSKFCNVVYSCSGTSPYRCANGICAANEKACAETSSLCPIASPIKCPAGNCVQSANECSKEYYTVQCTSGQFWCSLTSSCVSSAAECVGVNFAAGSVQGSSRRLQEVTPRTQASDPTTSNPSTVSPQNQCDNSAPYSCYDGTCRAKLEDCPIIPACKVMEYRCQNGSCQTDQSKCKENAVVCETGLNKCEDGLCRKECPPYNGCGLAKPFQCTNGMCVKNDLECIGFSMCNPDLPYRCIDGSCVSDPATCPDIMRLYSINKMEVSVSKYTSVNIPFAFDNYKRIFAQIFIPANSLALKTNSTANFASMITIEEVAQSTLYSSSVQYNSSDYITYNVSNGIEWSDGVLDFEDSVMSPVFTISSTDLNGKMSGLGQITIEHNYYLDNKFLASDYCLAKLLYSTWECVSRKASNEQTTFTFDSFGTYAVVLNPYRELTEVNSTQANSFFFDNIRTITIVVGVLFLVAILVFYIFTRVIRYREKYKDHKEKMVNLQNQMEDYRNMSTDVPGQTLGDNIAGIVFTRNPALSVTTISKGSANDLENEIEELQRKCRAVENQNRSLEERIQDVNDQYKTLKMELDRMKNQDN